MNQTFEMRGGINSARMWRF